ncbi:MAG: DUF3616 domain-containing protein [Planctomycetes bacterium]|nr:DUF3616 domain-containing protein [Planctomycetota bacterium]
MSSRFACAALLGAACLAPASGCRTDSAGQHATVLVEASAVAVCAGGSAAVVAGDEARDRLWGVGTERLLTRWELPFPPGTPPLDDVEALAPWGEHQLFIMCSQSRTKPHARAKPERGRLALATLSADARQITAVRVWDGVREALLAHLAAEAREFIADLGALADGTPLTGGLNVEGLAAWHGQLLVGLRSPAARGGALVVPIRNPQELAAGGEAVRPEFGKPLLLPAATSEGIRGLTGDGETVLALLGPAAEGNQPPRILRWNPASGEVRRLSARGLDAIAKPEGIALDAQGRLLVVQDLSPPIKDPVLFRLELSPE